MNIRIKTKKDWVIASIFALLVIYGITTRFSFRLQAFLLPFGNSKLTNMNQPRSYGNLIITTLIMTLLAEIVFIIHHKPVRVKIIAPLAGFLCSVLLFAGYLINCNLIVSVTGKEEPKSVHARGWGTDMKLNMNGEQQNQLVTSQKLRT